MPVRTQDYGIRSSADGNPRRPVPRNIGSGSGKSAGSLRPRTGICTPQNRNGSLSYCHREIFGHVVARKRRRPRCICCDHKPVIIYTDGCPSQIKSVS